MSTVNSLVIHANLVVIYNLGILLTGKPKLGKSTLSLALLDRGHQLVSDDATELFLHGQTLYGKCPGTLQGLLQIDYLGLTDITSRFGAAAHCTSHSIQLGVQLTQLNELPPLNNPLAPVVTHSTYLDTTLVTIPLPNHTPAILALQLETLAYNVLHHRLNFHQQTRSTPCKNKD